MQDFDALLGLKGKAGERIEGYLGREKLLNHRGEENCAGTGKAFDIKCQGNIGAEDKTHRVAATTTPQSGHPCR